MGGADCEPGLILRGVAAPRRVRQPAHLRHPGRDGQEVLRALVWSTGHSSRDAQRHSQHAAVGRSGVRVRGRDGHPDRPPDGHKQGGRVQPRPIRQPDLCHPYHRDCPHSGGRPRFDSGGDLRDRLPGFFLSHPDQRDGWGEERRPRHARDEPLVRHEGVGSLAQRDTPVVAPIYDGGAPHRGRSRRRGSHPGGTLPVRVRPGGDDLRLRGHLRHWRHNRCCRGGHAERGRTDGGGQVLREARLRLVPDGTRD